MDDSEKLEELRAKLDSTDDDDSTLLSYLEQAKAAILYQMNQYMTDEEYEAAKVPIKYEQKQLQIAVYLYNRRGSEGELSHSENGISRSYEAADVPPSMLRGITPCIGIPR